MPIIPDIENLVRLPVDEDRQIAMSFLGRSFVHSKQGRISAILFAIFDDNPAGTASDPAIAV